MLTPAQSAPSTRVPALPSVKCSTCAFPVPLSSLSDHVCSPQQHRLRGDSQPLPRARPSNAYTPSPNLASRVPFPTMATPAPRPEDYMPGGQSGMAGVGRRAFQSPAFAPVFVLDAIQQPPQGMQGRRPNPPQFLDIASTSGKNTLLSRRYHDTYLFLDTATPPLSPNSTQSSPRSHSPRSPVSQSPINSVPVITGSRTPSPALLPRRWASRTHSNRSHSPPPRNAPTPSSTSSRPLLAQHHKNTLGQTPSVSPSPSSKNDTSHNPRAELIGPSSPTDSDSSGHGLAYDRDDGKEGTDEEKVIAGRYSLDKERVSVSSQSAYSTASRTRLTRDDLLASSPRRSHTTPTVGPRGGAGGFASPLGSASPPGSGAARSVSDAKNLRREKDKATASRPRICVRCERNIEGGRWVRTDTNKGVLCERCWKNMYLPKVCCPYLGNAYLADRRAFVSAGDATSRSNRRQCTRRTDSSRANITAIASAVSRATSHFRTSHFMCTTGTRCARSITTRRTARCAPRPHVGGQSKARAQSRMWGTGTTRIV